MYRRWVSETGWLQYWLRRRTGLNWVLYVGRHRLEYVLRVYECGCKDLGEDGQLCAVLLGWAALLSWHICVGVVELSAAGVQICVQML